MADLAAIHEEWTGVPAPGPDAGDDASLHHVDADHNAEASDDYQRRVAEARTPGRAV